MSKNAHESALVRNAHRLGQWTKLLVSLTRLVRELVKLAEVAFN